MRLGGQSGANGDSNTRYERARLLQQNIVHTSFGDIRTTSPKPAVRINLMIRRLRSLTIFPVELHSQVGKTDTLHQLHICKPQPCTCRTAWTREVGERVEVDVVDNPKKAVPQQDSGGHQ